MVRARTCRHHLVSRVVVWILWFAGGASLGGCNTLPLDPNYAGPTPVPDDVLTEFAYPRPNVIVTDNEIIERNWWYVIERVRFKSAVSDVVGEHELVVDYFNPCGRPLGTPAGEARPVIVVLPILGGGNAAANYFAGHFARNGYAAVIVHRQEAYKTAETLAMLNTVFKQIVTDHRQALDWMEHQPGIDMNHVGLFGISAGAVKGTLVMAIDHRIDTAILALAAGDLPHILTHSDDRGIRVKREEALKKHQITVEELHDAIRSEFRFDPLSYAPYIDARRVLLVLAERDEIVFFENGMRLREAMGRPRTIVVPTGHYSAVVFVPFIQQVTLDFFDDQLQP